MKNVVWHDHAIKREDREQVLGQQAVLLWFTGLSGSGKSTIANALQKKMHSEGKLAYILDGDNVRHGLNSDLGFSQEHRTENIRRISEVAKLFVDAGFAVISAFISPYIKDREDVRLNLGKDFIEVYIKCDLATCEERDPKGMYKKARRGEIKNYTGISAPYEEPVNPDVVVDTTVLSPEESVDKIFGHLKSKGFF